MDEPWKLYAMVKKPDTKGHILYDSIFMKCLKQANLQKQKADQWFRVMGQWEIGVTAHGYGVWGNDEIFWTQMMMMVAGPCKCTKNYWIVHFKQVNFIVCELELDGKIA